MSRPPSLAQTSLGYHYLRCRAGEDDSTVYVHALCAIADGGDPAEVFSDQVDVHHRPLSEWLELEENVGPTPLEVGGEIVPAIDTAEAVKLEARYDHRLENLG